MALVQLETRPERLALSGNGSVDPSSFGPRRIRLRARCTQHGLRSVLVVDDRPLSGEMLQAALRRHGFSVTLIAPADAAHAATRVSAAEPATVLVTLRGSNAGEAATLTGHLVAARCRVVVLADAACRLDVAACIEAGASAVAATTSRLTELVDVVARVAAGEQVLSDHERTDHIIELREQRRHDDARRAPFERLTPRERDVLRNIAAGHSAAAIAEESFVSLATVRTQIRSILQKLDVKSQVAAVAFARSVGWS